MAKSGFKAAVRLVKTVNREIKKVEREAAKNHRQREMQARKKERELERKARQASRLETVNRKEKVKAEISEAKEAYQYRCEERRFLREQIINEELK